MPVQSLFIHNTGGVPRYIIKGFIDGREQTAFFHVSLLAQRLHEQINEFITIPLRYALVPDLKTILRWTGIDCGPFLVPRRAF
jgi:hypothetical protein